MGIKDRYGLWFVIFVIALLSIKPAASQTNDIVNYRVLSETPDKLVLEIHSYYTGSHGATAHISVLPTVNNQVSGDVGYSAGQCPNSNNIGVGPNSTCMTLSSINPARQFVTTGIQVCMFGGPGGGMFHCEILHHNKQWGTQHAFPAPPPPPVSGGQLYVTASPSPPVVARGQQTQVRVYVSDAQGRPVPQATVTVSCGGGRFVRTGTSSVSGTTDAVGVFLCYWSCNPCSRAYVSGVTASKQGHIMAKNQWRVDIP